MTTTEYRAYKRKLEEQGYTYYPNQPYTGWNQWRKYYQCDTDFEAMVCIQVFDKTEFEQGITLLVEGEFNCKSEAPVRIQKKFGYDPDLDFVDSNMKELTEKIRVIIK